MRRRLGQELDSESLIQGRAIPQPLSTLLPGNRVKQSQRSNQTSCMLQESARRRRGATGSTRVPWMFENVAMTSQAPCTKDASPRELEVPAGSEAGKGGLPPFQSGRAHLRAVGGGPGEGRRLCEGLFCENLCLCALERWNSTIGCLGMES